ncbi:MAG: hypothetical protein BGO25_09235 [Acidobacteriales bacterium 59-55]|nr:hypothetical protein [Terriglobales bacterium]OJV39972.1 MAG: hypothetical protein BGO25_09235 [Acidobacteriales bacterium 59-55]
MTSTSSLVLDQVVALIEPLTRFDRSSVQLHEESEQTLSCTGVWTSSYAISSSVSDGTGELPSGVRDAGSQSGMERAINETISGERSNVVQRIQSWCDRQAQSSPSAHKPLTSGDCISGITRIGYTWKCSSCKGRGKTTCSTCNGNGKVTCSYCNGKGRTNCSQCQGKGKTTCSYCGGRGSQSRQIEKRGYNSATQQSFPIYETVWERCGSCQSGETACGACHGGGTVSCSCNGAGTVTCNSCLGKGEQTCNSCKGTGALHRIAETACQVTNNFTIQSGDFDEEDEQTTTNWDFQTFCQLANATSKAPDITASQLRRTYSATLSRTQARLECAGQGLLLRGYGPEARVFDFKGIVGHLLAQDLEQLHSTLNLPWGFLPFRNQGTLHTALSSMLQSELNQQLTNPQQRAALVANRTVTEEHATTTARCLRKAMSRLYSATATVGLAVLFVVAYATLHNLLWSGYMLPQNRPVAAVIFLGVVALTAIAAEFFARYFFLRGFSSSGNTESRKAASRLLHSTGTIRRWRIAAAITTVAVIISFFAVTL